MDPNAALQSLREKMNALQVLVDGGPDVITTDAEDAEYRKNLEAIEDLSSEILDLWHALDHWLSTGGYIPTSWELPL